MAQSLSPVSTSTCSDSSSNINVKRSAKSASNELLLPVRLRSELKCTFSVTKYDLQGLLTRILLDKTDISTLEQDQDEGRHPLARLHLLPSFQSKTHGRPKLANRRWRSRGLVGKYHAELRFLYGQFVEEVIKPCVRAAADEELVFQRMPVLRIQTPSTKALGKRHRDEEYMRQLTEINIWLPLVDVSGNNSLWVESERDLGDFHPFNLEYGQFVRFR